MAGQKEFDAHGKTLVFNFENTRAANLFKGWLCGAGERDYWDWMNYREDEEDGPITGIKFNYHTGTDEITVECGRLERSE